MKYIIKPLLRFFALLVLLLYYLLAFVFLFFIDLLTALWNFEFHSLKHVNEFFNGDFYAVCGSEKDYSGEFIVYCWYAYETPLDFLLDQKTKRSRRATSHD